MRVGVIKAIRLLVIATLLALVSRKTVAQKALRMKFQDWNEDDDRIRVRSWYVEAETMLGEQWGLDVVGLVDVISGATPMGRTPTNDPDDWLAQMDEERRAGIVTLSQEGDVYDFSFEFGLSHEPDYLSRSYAARLSRSFASDTLTFNAGLSYLDDVVDTNVPGGPDFGDQDKSTPEFMFGIHRILSPKSTVLLNLSYGRPNGYLSDPHKGIGYSQVFFGTKQTFITNENRPEERETYAAYVETTRFFESLNASLETSYRFFADDADLTGHTLEVKWLQRMGEKFVLRPIIRHYLQNQTDFYLSSLDGTGIIPGAKPTRTAPYYSADYRLSDLRTLTYGLKLTYFPQDDFSLDLAFDRYDMKGRDGITSQLMYPDANVLTLGLQWEF